MYLQSKKMWKKNQGIKKFTSINTESTIRTIEYQFEYDEQVGTRNKGGSVNIAIEDFMSIFMFHLIIYCLEKA